MPSPPSQDISPSSCSDIHASNAQNEPAPGSPKRPLPSPAASPIPGSSLPRIFSLKPSYKRARTASPIIDENSSEPDQERSAKSSSEHEDLEISNTPGRSALHISTSLQQVTGLNADASMASSSESGSQLEGSSLRTQEPDGAVDGLITERSLSLNDPGGVRPATPSSAMTDSEQLPFYQESTQNAPIQRAVAPTVAPPPGSEQLDAIRALKSKPLRASDLWYLIDRSWYKRWSTVCSSEDSVVKQGKQEVEESVEVGPIDCRALAAPNPENGGVAEQPKLRSGLVEGSDFELLPEEAWKVLESWYGVEGPVFPRKVISTSSVPGYERVELYPPEFTVFLLAPTPPASQQTRAPTMRTKPFITTLSISRTVGELKLQAVRAFGLDWPDSRFWRLPLSQDATLNEEQKATAAFVLPDKLREDGVELVDAGEDQTGGSATITLADVQLDVDTRLVLEQRATNGSWLVDSSATLSSTSEPAGQVTTSLAQASAPRPVFSQQGDFFSSLQSKAAPEMPSMNRAVAQNRTFAGPGLGRMTRSKTAAQGTDRTRGLRGLMNLGNTCFMNSALQCMSNSAELQQYFLSGVYQDELNTDNPLGMGGAVAEAFGSLIQKIWSGDSNSLPPREFKQTLSRFAPQFSGYAQHDSQELLAFLLDGLHEDLNRIKNKPYVEAPDWEGGGEKELVAFAKRQWEIYKMRNDSVIVDLFQGQYKSTLVCPVCNKVSIKFDPFMYLTLPIPVIKKWKGVVYYVPYDPSKPIRKVQMQMPKDATMMRIRQKLAEWFEVSEAKKIVGGEVYSNRVYRWYHDYEPVTEISGPGDFAYFWEVPYEFSPPKRALRQHKKHAFTFGKATPPPEEDEDFPTTEEPATIVPVFSQTSSGVKSSRRFAKSHREEKFGVPFLVAVPRDQVNSYEAIYNAVLNQYRRFSNAPDDLAEHAITAAATRSHTPAGSSDWEMVDGTGPKVETVQLQAGVEQAQDTITEIREDGEAVEMVVESSQPDADAPVAKADENLLNGGGPAEVNAANAANAESGSSSPAPKRLFKLQFVPDRRLQDEPMPKLFSEQPTDTQELGSRISRLQKLPAKTDAEPAPSQGEGEDGTPAAAGPTDPNDPQQESVGTRARPPPALFTGTGLIVEWEPAARQQYFDEARETNVWGTIEDFVDPEVTAERAAGGPRKAKAITIEDCMDEFTREEQLGEEDPWYCPSCKEFRRATKKFDLWKVPDILVVHLKRFSSGRMARDKLDTNVDFPLEGLNLEQRVEGARVVRELRREEEGRGVEDMPKEHDEAVAVDTPIYDLYAVDNHFGGLGGGHYTAYAKNPTDNRWYNYDDSHVSPVSDPETVKSSAAYLLFYRRRTTRPIGGKSRAKVQEAVAQNTVNGAVDAVDGGAEAGPSSFPAFTQNATQPDSSAFSSDQAEHMQSHVSYNTADYSPPASELSWRPAFRQSGPSSEGSSPTYEMGSFGMNNYRSDTSVPSAATGQGSFVGMGPRPEVADEDYDQLYDSKGYASDDGAEAGSSTGAVVSPSSSVGDLMEDVDAPIHASGNEGVSVIGEDRELGQKGTETPFGDAHLNLTATKVPLVHPSASPSAPGESNTGAITST